MDQKMLRQNLNGHCIKANIQMAKKPVKRCHFIRVVSVSTFVKTEAENLLVCLRPTYTSFLYDLFISVLCSSLLTRKMQI